MTGFAARRWPSSASAPSSARRLGAVGLLLAVIAACAPMETGEDSASAPPPASPAPSEAPSPPQDRSARSRLVERHYADTQRADLARGLMRTDGGGPDVPYSADDLARTFEQVAFYGEYQPGAGLTAGDGRPDILRRWQGPVRLRAEFGPSVTTDRQHAGDVLLSDYARRLGDAAGHPVQITGGRANFHVLVMGEDDRSLLLNRVSALVPGLGPSSLNVLRVLPLEVPCLVMGFGREGRAAVYDTAIAIIRAELPDLMFEACIHEEVAQGLGLRNDSPAARPSIFNDDAEFALLTGLDEAMLAMLYDARLSPGMTLDEARPIVRTIAGDLMPDS